MPFHMRQLPLQTLLTFLGWIGRANCCQATIKFLLYQSRLFRSGGSPRPKQSDREILPDKAAVVANRAA